MIRSPKTLGKLAAATLVAAAFLTSALVSARPTDAGSPSGQDPAKTVEIKVQVKEVVKEQPAAAPVPVPPAKEVAKEKAETRAEAKAAVKKAVPAAPIRILPAQAANVDAMAQQFIQSLRPMLGVELRLLTSACEPSPAQRREIAIEGGKALKEASKRIAEAQMGLNQAVRRGEPYPEPRKMIHDAMEAAAKAKLSPEQFARYQKEMEDRAKDQREVTMLNLVASLDKLLFFSTEQREKVCASLLTHWDDRSFPTLETLVMYETYYPVIPDQSITPILTEEQRKIWRSAQKINFSTIRNFNFFNNGMNGGVVEVEDEDEKAALAEEVKK